MELVISTAAMIPGVGEVLVIAAVVVIVGSVLKEAGFFDWLCDVITVGWDWLSNGFGKVVQKGKSVVQDDIIPGILSGIDWLCKAVTSESKGKKYNAEAAAEQEKSKEAPKTNKEADKAAEDLGYEKTNEKSHGQTVYKNKKGKKPKYITCDADSHNGGVWKGADTIKIWVKNQLGQEHMMEI